jgi:LacI family transcriptional regulator
MKIQDIAKKLNLSITTVSRALDGYPDVAESTRQRVIEMAEELGYEPNQAARDLRRQRTNAIGFIRPFSSSRYTDPSFSEFLSGLGDEATAQKIDVLVSAAPPEEAEEIKIYKRWINSHKVAGFVLNQLRIDDRRVDFLRQEQFPFAAIDSSSKECNYPCVNVQCKSAMIELVDHLVGRGFHRFAYLGGQDELTMQRARCEGFLSGLRKHKLSLDPQLVVTSDMTSANAHAQALELLQTSPRPDAIVCFNDELAFGVLRAANELGLKVGDELAVTGFEGVSAGNFSEPPLTTMDIPIYDIARSLIQLLAGSLAGEKKTLNIQPRLLVRSSG